jgi:hypothetical protein
MIGLGRAVRQVVAIAVTAALVVLSSTAGVAHADVAAAVDDDLENQLWDCVNRHVPFGDGGEDVLRCLTFRFHSPKKLRSAVLYLDISAPTNSLQDTDALVVAVDQPFDECAWGQGTMPGCVMVHGGFQGGERSLVVDMLNLACDPAVPVPIDQVRQDAVRRAVESGVLHIMLEDDTAVLGGWLDINGDSAPTCGTTSEPVPAQLLSQVGKSGGSEDSGVSAKLIVGAAAGVAVIAAAGVTATKRTRMRRVDKRIEVKRVPAAPTVELDQSSDPQHPPSVAVGVSSYRDDIGSQILSEGVA